MPSFHSLEEQEAFEDAEEAYEKFIEIRDRCREELANREDEEEPETTD